MVLILVRCMVFVHIRTQESPDQCYLSGLLSALLPSHYLSFGGTGLNDGSILNENLPNILLPYTPATSFCALCMAWASLSAHSVIEF